jgi:hypothetical protein
MNLRAAFERSLKNAGEPAGVRFTERQLYYELCRAMRPVPGLDAGPARVLLGLGLCPLLFTARRRPKFAVRVAVAGTVAAGALRLLRKAPYTLAAPIPYAEFARLLNSHVAQHGRPHALLVTEAAAPAPVGERAPELTRYGLPRLLVCENDEIAQMLRANRFHMEASCAVLSLAQATPVPGAIREMLARAEGARIYFLHDASLKALSTVQVLRARLGLSEATAVPIIAVGLRPVHAWRLHLFADRPQENGTPVKERPLGELPQYLTRAEQQWLLSGWRSEVAAVNPARLLRTLRRIILGAPQSSNRGAGRHLFLPHRSVGFMTWHYEP